MSPVDATLLAEHVAAIRPGMLITASYASYKDPVSGGAAKAAGSVSGWVSQVVSGATPYVVVRTAPAGGGVVAANLPTSVITAVQAGD